MGSSLGEEGKEGGEWEVERGENPWLVLGVVGGKQSRRLSSASPASSLFLFLFARVSSNLV